MNRNELEEQVLRLEGKYSEELRKHSNVHVLSEIWVHIKALKTELSNRDE